MSSSQYDCFDLDRVVAEIAAEIQVGKQQVLAAIELLDAGNTLPFIARYRKEATRGLDELALRQIEDLLSKARELADRKATVLKTIDEQGKLTVELRRQIETCGDKRLLEDIYLPFKPKRRTKATVARERGLEPLADILLRQENINQSRAAVVQPFVSAEREVPDVDAALEGACHIVAEVWSENAETRDWLKRQAVRGRMVSKVKRGQKDSESKFAQYFDASEPVSRMPSHRFLAMQRGEQEGVLRLQLELDDEAMLRQLRQQWITNPRFEFQRELTSAAEDCYQRLLLPATESATFQQLKEAADVEAVGVFAQNLRQLLLAAPAGPYVTIGLDPGFRTGCKLAVVDGTGKFLDHATIYPTPPRNDTEGAARTLRRFLEKYQPRWIAIGNGTASRETEKFVRETLKDVSQAVNQVTVNESGASIYSASELASLEYPDLDVTVRGAISIAHRLQDPLAELVKIDPKSIGVGQYQHDVNQKLLRTSLDREVESCVNSVGVDVNTASASLLSHVAGIGPKLAEGIVRHRDDKGRFRDRKQLLKVPKLGQKAFQQAAGFLRIADGDQPLDNSAVHPESYHVVERMARKLSSTTDQLVGNAGLSSRLDPQEFVSDEVGLPTIQDILSELAKPGRDPRSTFQIARFSEEVNELEDLREGMVLEGTVTNVTRFGAFVDVGVHQDGLIHISQLANNFVNDPSEVVAVGDVVKVKVLEVDVPRRRIALSRKAVS